MCLHYILLFTIQSHATSTIQQLTIWTFCNSLNAAFTQQLSLTDEGYESGTDNNDLPTPLRKTLRVPHISSLEHTSFNPELVTPQTPPRPVHR